MKITPCTLSPCLFPITLLFLACSLLLTPAASAQGQKWALLVGIDEYKDQQHINRLGGAAADARALGRTLVEVAGFPESQVHLLVSDADPRLGEQTPERNNILKELALLADKVHPGDTVVVAYSGHGIEANGVPALLPYDTDASSNDNVVETALPVARFTERLKQVHASTLLLIFDMCRTDPHKGTKDVATPNTLKSKQEEALQVKGASAPTVITLFACSPDQRSFEWTAIHRGYFSYFLDEGIRGKAADAQGNIQLGALMQYVASNVQKTVKVEQSQTQTPFYRLEGNTGTATEFVLAKNVSGIPPPLVADPKIETVDTEANFRISVNPPDATVTVDGVPVDGRTARLDLVLEKQRTIKVVAEAEGYLPTEQIVTVKRGLNPPVSLVLASSEAQTSAPATRPTPKTATTARGNVAVGNYGTTRQIPVGALDLIVVKDHGAAATQRRIIEDGEPGMQVTVSVPPFRENEIRLVYRPQELVEGATYRVRFRVRATGNDEVTVCCAGMDGRDIGFRQRYGLTGEWQQVDFTFRATGLSPRFNLAPVLLLGKVQGTVWISGIHVEQQ